MDEKLLWIAKGFTDIAIAIDELSESEKKVVIEIAEKNSPSALTELFNALNEYGEL